MDSANPGGSSQWSETDPTARWRLVERLARQLADDADLAEAFERTPGKVAGRLGIPPDAIPALLAALSRPVDPPSSEGERDRAPAGK